jgi:hypothetical protein
MVWFGKVGEKIADGRAPLGPRRSIGGNAASAATGYSVINAANLDEAVALTKGHPHLASGGSIEFCEAMPVGM